MTKTNEPNYQTDIVFTPIGNTRDVCPVLSANSQPIETGYTPISCTELKATIDLYDRYSEMCVSAVTKYEKDYYANIGAVLLNRIKDMEKRLLYELEVKCSE
jgi:hypothetical protein